MGLSTNPGAQIQGVNVQGLEISKDFVEVNIEWIDSDTSEYFDPSTYSVTITKDGNTFDSSNLTIMSPLSRRDDRVGYWHFSFLTKSKSGSPIAAGQYDFSFTGTNSSTGNSVTLTLGFTAAEIPVQQYFVNSLRARLGDRRASNYLVDDPTTYRWTDGDLYGYLEDARLDIGATPPKPEDFTYEVLYADAHGLLLMGGFIYALKAKGIFETFNAFNYNDAVSLNLDRKVLYQNAQGLLQSWNSQKTAWKRDRIFHSIAGGRGMASGRFPMYFTRVLSMQPNMGNTFYG